MLPASWPVVLLALPPNAASATVLRVLRDAGMTVSRIADGIGVLDALRAEPADLLILDVELPGLDAAAVVAAAHREAPMMPVVAITPRERRAATVGGLRGYQDDYLLRPFTVDELVARAQLRLRAGAPLEQTIVRRGELVVDTVLGEASVEGTPAGLSPTEFALLKALLDEPERPVTAERLAEQVWERPASANLVQVYVGYLRRKIGTDRIRTVRGAGYMLDA